MGESSIGGLNPDALNVILATAGILVLIYIIALIVSSLSSRPEYNWPPWKSKCPDYWSTSKDSSGNIICTKSRENPNGINSRCAPFSTNSSNGYYVGSGSNIINMTNASQQDKCNWAKECNVIWENVDNKC